MQFNGNADGQDLVTLCDDYAKSNASSYPLARKVRMANIGMKKIWKLIWRIFGGWVYDDNNYTTLPEAVTTLNANRVQYPAPLEASDLLGVSVMDTGGNWWPLKPITLEEINDRYQSEADFMNIAGLPIWYRPIANGFKIYPASDVEVASGLKAYFSRTGVLFTVDSTTQEPGFDVDFHEGVAIFMALQYAKINSKPVAGGVMRGGFKTGLLADWNDFLTDITSFYRARFRQQYPQRLRNRDITRDFI